MSVELDRSPLTCHWTDLPIAAMARRRRIDPRIPAIVPGFDAPFFQAGLAGYSDGAMRLMARRHGCPYCITEALLDRTLLAGGKGRRREHPDLLQRELSGAPRVESQANPCTNARDPHPARLALRDKPWHPVLRHSELRTQSSELDLLPGETLGDPAENRVANIGVRGRGRVPDPGFHDHPVAGQIMGSHPDEIARGAAVLVDMNYDVIDVNLACPVKKIRKSNRGGHCLTNPDQSIALLRAVRQVVPPRIPCTVKMRRAFDDTPEMAMQFERIFNAAYELGYAWATVHCRTVVQKYHGPGRWSFLTDLARRHPDKVIFGSGDVWSAEDIFAMLELTGVHAVAVARGCIGNPWIFRQARQLMAGEPASMPSIDEQRGALMDHFHLAVALHGEKRASQMMRKFGIKFAAHHPRRDEVRLEFIRCRDVAQWRAVIERWYAVAELVAPWGWSHDK